MTKLTVNDLGTTGVIEDVQQWMLTPEAWSAAQNARMSETGASRIPGESKALGTASAGWGQKPVWLGKAKSPTLDFWVGFGTTKIYARNTGPTYTETDVSRVGTYNATEAKKWACTMMEGFMVATNGADQPQYWDLNTSHTFLDLNNLGTGTNKWPTNYTCSVMVPFGKFLVACDITKGGVRFPNLVKWSHEADTGNLPLKWDPTDVTTDAGEYSLSDTRGAIVDALPLGQILAIYKEDVVVGCRYVGGQYVFDLSKKLITTQGLLAQHCVASYGDDIEWHFCVGKDDIYIHNGQTITSIASLKFKRSLFNKIDKDNYATSFVVTNRSFSEVWFCFPENGMQQPTQALIWNWKTNALSYRDLLKTTTGSATRSDITTYGTPCIAADTLVDTNADPWSGDSASWDSDTTIWDQNTGSPIATKLFMLDRTSNKLSYLLDDTNQFDGTDFQMLVERTGLAITKQDRKGNWTIDTEAEKLIQEVWPHLSGTTGVVVYFSIGTQDMPDAGVVWSVEKAYIVGSSDKLDFYESGRLFGIRMRAPSAQAVQLQSYEIDVSPTGKF